MKVLVSLALLGLVLASGCTRRVGPLITLSSEGTPQTCELGVRKSTFSPGDQLAFLVDLKRPFDTNEVVIRFYRITEKGSHQPLFSQQLMVRPEHTAFCVIDPKFTVRDYVGSATGEITVELTRSEQVLARTRFEVVSAPAPEIVPAAAAEASRNAPESSEGSAEGEVPGTTELVPAAGENP